MKSRLLSVLLVLSFLGACERDPAPYGLEMATIKIIQSMDSLDHELANAAFSIAATDLRHDTIQRELEVLYNSISFLKEADFINILGIMQVVVPAAYSAYEGANFSTDNVIMNVIHQHKPYLTNDFLAREGYHAVADMHPVFNGSTDMGAIEALFTPADLIGRILKSLVKPPDEIWVMAEDGTTMFEPDLTGNGLNVFTDPYYGEFEDFRTACHTIADNESGHTTYTFYETGTTTGVSKKVWWNTIHLHDNAWKVIWSQEE